MDDKNRVYWACKRGMLELDLILIPFFENHYNNLSIHEKRIFSRLLTATDPELFTWLLGREGPPQEMVEIIEKIIKR